MQTTALGDTGIETSILGLGCANLFDEPSGRRRLELLETAFDSGVRHFDTAPMYGLGDVEAEVGRFARGRRDRLVIATKFGIAPTAAARLLSLVQGPLQRLLAAPRSRARARPAARDPRAGAVGAALYRTTGYDAAAARTSLERSLRALATDHVDLLFLHDPLPGSIRSDDVRGYLDSAVERGDIRAWGVAGEPAPAVEAAERLSPPVPVLQLRDDVLQRSLRAAPDDVRRATIVFGALSHALPRIRDHLRADERAHARWNETLGCDCSDDGEIASLLLRDALLESGGPLLFSTTKPDRARAAAAAAATPPDERLEAFRALAARELTPPAGAR